MIFITLFKVQIPRIVSFLKSRFQLFFIDARTKRCSKPTSAVKNLVYHGLFELSGYYLTDSDPAMKNINALLKKLDYHQLVHANVVQIKLLAVCSHALQTLKSKETFQK